MTRPRSPYEVFDGDDRHPDGRPKAVKPPDGDTIDVIHWDDQLLVRRVEKSAGDLTYTTIRIDRYEPSRSDNWGIVAEIRERVAWDALDGLVKFARAEGGADR